LGNNGKCRWGLGFRNSDKYFLFFDIVIPITENGYFSRLIFLKANIFRGNIIGRGVLYKIPISY